MKQSRRKLAQTIADRTIKAEQGGRLATEVAAYLLAEHRVNELDSILRDVQADWAAAGYVEVLAYSAHPLTTGVRTQIEREVTKLYPDAHRIVITEINDLDAIGGVRLTVANQQLDLSIEAKLNKFKQLTLTGKE
jgi:F0F1-type ATP synthase delta subunit